MDVGGFFDDEFFTEPVGLAASGFWAFKRLCLILGIPASGRKEQPPTRELVFRWAQISIGDSFVRPAARPGRVKNFAHILHMLYKKEALRRLPRVNYAWNWASTHPCLPA